MAEDSAKRSRWRGKLFSKEKERDKDRDEDAQLSRQTEEKLKLNNDVMDFLAPSIAKSQAMQRPMRPAGASPPKVPRIDIAAAQRWPGAHDVGKGSPGPRSGGPLSSSLKGGSGSMGGVNKKRRKAHLKVAFAKTEPEIIGEGGEEAELPTIAVGKIREHSPHRLSADGYKDDTTVGMPQFITATDRQLSPGRPGSSGLRRAHTVSHENTPPIQQSAWSPPQQAQIQEDNFRPSPLKRSATGFSEVTEFDRQERPSLDSEDFRPAPLRRTATGFSDISEADRPSFEEEDNPFSDHQTSAGTDSFMPDMDRAPRLPEIDLVVSESPLEYRKSLSLSDNYLPASPSDPSSFSARLIHKMRAEEGRVLHEAIRNSIAMDDSDRPSISSEGSHRPESSHYSPEQTHVKLIQPTPSRPPAQSSYSYQPAPAPKPPLPLNERPPISTTGSYPPPLQPQQQHHLQVSGYGQDMPQGGSPVPPAHMSLTPREQSPASLRGNYGQPTPSPRIQPPGTSSNYFPPHLAPQPSQQRPPMHQIYSDPPPQHDFQHYSQLQPTYPAPAPAYPSQPSQLQSQQQPQQPSSQPPPLQVQPPPSPRGPLKSLATRVSEAAGSLPSPTVNSNRTSNSSLTPPVIPPGNFSPAGSLSQNTSAEMALEDFTERVQHMSGIFRLTAEVVQPAARYTPKQWLRCALWWFLRGRAGLEGIMRGRARESRGNSPNDARPGSRQDSVTGGGMRLCQAHVDLAKVVWMLQDIFPSLSGLQTYTGSGRMGLTAPATIAAAREAADTNNVQVLEGIEVLSAALKMLLASCARNDAMPPHASLIQGQDQSIWVQYPQLPAEAQSVVLSSPASSPTNLTPLGDTKMDFAFGRMFVNVTLSSPDGERSDPVPCLLSILRERNTWGLKVMICSQTEAITVCIQDEHERSKEAAELSLPGPGWRDVNWESQQARLFANISNLNPGAGGKIGMMVEFTQQDFAQLVTIWNYTRNVAVSMMPGKEEKMVHEVVTVALQHSEEIDPSRQPPQMPQQPSFPTERVKRCRVRVFEKYEYYDFGTGRRKLHRGFRVLAITSPKIKNLSSLSINVGDIKPVVCEMVTENSTGESRPALVLKAPDESRSKTSTLVVTLHSPPERQTLLDIFTGVALQQGESVLAHVRLSMLGIEQVGQAEAFAQSGKDPLRTVRWQDVMVIGDDEDDMPRSAEELRSVMSARFRIVVRANGVIVTERLNIVPGELKMRLPATGSSSTPSSAISIFRSASPRPPCTTMTSISSQPSSQLPNAISSLLDIAARNPTLETFHFPSLLDLHSFQSALCSHRVLFDGLSSGFTISHRRALVPVPVHKRQYAHDVRVQILKRDGDSSALLVAFFEGFTLAESMAFKLLGTDAFEKVDGKKAEREMGGARWGVRLVDAKFALPGKDKDKDKEKDRDGEDGDGGRTRHRRQKSKDSGRESRNGLDGKDDEAGGKKGKAEERFVCVDLLEYPGEHDDIVIGFDEESERDSFLDALPAAPQVSRSITFKRKI
ncbi:hypothetical protein NA57DRAFT_80806 [Rhizodiscina lignyota]|uniref:Uncharacterized protein n=1 Tax=Rhizodiscina lignyota TaxID=1504668 RepID=A0A9P4M1T1_9PEZI|nr:hypothetical protein NA57DRAFT_80806 [Rhizodiscina lignyota]